MTAKDGKGDPQDGPLKSNSLFPPTKEERQHIHARLVSTLQQHRDLSNQLATIVREKRGTLKLLHNTAQALLDEIEVLG